MKYLISILLCSLLLIDPAIADKQETIFEGFDTKIVSVLDIMTDEVSGVLFADFGPVYMAIYGNDDFAIWTRRDDLHFAFDSIHLIRVGKNKPFPLKYIAKRNGLRPVDPSHAESVIKSLVKGEMVKIRYYNWPQHDSYYHHLKNINLAYVYGRAVKKFGWKDFGVPAKLKPVELSVEVSKNPDHKGYAIISVNGNPNLALHKGFDEYGGGCYIEVGVKKTFGIQKGKWCCNDVDLMGKNRIIIRNLNDEIVFEGVVPKNYGPQIFGNPWPLGEKAAKTAWKVGSLGSIETEGSHGKKVRLYGFKELWIWGVENADLPPLE